MSSEVKGVTKPAMVRIARTAGVKSVSDDCFPVIRSVIYDKLDEIVKASLVMNSEHQTKTLMPEDIYGALRIKGHKVARSAEIGNTSSK